MSDSDELWGLSGTRTMPEWRTITGGSHEQPQSSRRAAYIRISSDYLTKSCRHSCCKHRFRDRTLDAPPPLAQCNVATSMSFELGITGWTWLSSSFKGLTWIWSMILLAIRESAPTPVVVASGSSKASGNWLCCCCLSLCPIYS